MQQELCFQCIRSHTFFSRTYYLKTTDTFLLISSHIDYKNPKYRIDLKLTTQILWKVINNQIKAFGIVYGKKIKYFEANHNDLTHLRQRLAGKVIFRNMASFYQPVDYIGEGLSAQVIKSLDVMTGETFAVKMIKKDFGFDQQAMEVVKNEVLILKQLNHKNIAKVREVYQNDDTYWIVQEYVQGLPLSDVLKQTLTKPQIKSIITELLVTVDYFQSLKIVHRDIKPENIIVLDQQYTRIKLIDFGFAANVKSSQAGSVCGTPGYYAPELLRYKESSYNSDMFSVGVVFYNLLTNQPLYKAQLNQTKKLINEEYAEDLLVKMLESDPIRRITAQQALCHPYFDDFAFPMQSIEEGERHECQIIDQKSIKSLRTQKTKPN